MTLLVIGTYAALSRSSRIPFPAPFREKGRARRVGASPEGVALKVTTPPPPLCGTPPIVRGEARGN